MKKIEFKFKSNDGITDIRAIKYIPDGKILGVLQISHGMIECIDRYDDFMSFICKKGYVVVGNDHLGHGESVNSYDDWGYFSDKNGYLYIEEDLFKLCKMTKQDYNDVPYFLLGHSMGSFLARLFLIEHGQELSGAIIVGTGYIPNVVLELGKVITSFIACIKGWRYRSKIVDKISMGSNNSKWEPSDTHLDWLTRDKKIVDWYANEPKCTFRFTLNGFYNLFSLLMTIQKIEDIKRIPKELPILFLSGEDDPIGNYGKGVIKTFNLFEKCNIKNINFKLYKNDRHEILNELNKNEVYLDVYNFIEKMRG